MKFRIKTSVTIFLLISSFFVSAQNKKLENFMLVKLESEGQIRGDNQTLGYYYFFLIDKIDSLNSKFELKVVDNQLELIFEEEIVLPHKSTLFESSYDGNILIFKVGYFITKTNCGIKMYMYGQDKKLRLANDIQNNELGYSSKSLTNWSDFFNKTIIPIESGGFLNYNAKINERVFELSRLNRDGSQNWEYRNTKSKSDSKEKYNHLGILGTKVFSLTTSSKDATHGYFVGEKNVSQSISVFDFLNGKLIKNTDLEDENFKHQILNAEPFDDNKILILGLFYQKDKNLETDFPVGFFKASLDSLGRLTEKNYLDFKFEFKDYLTPEMIKTGFSERIFFHNFFRLKDGSLFVIGESYKKKLDALGLAVKLMGSTSTGAFTFETDDIFVIEIDSNFSIKKATMFEKDKNTYWLNRVYGSQRAASIGIKIKYFDMFDYKFTQFNDDKSSFTVYYQDILKEQGEKFYQFHAIKYSDKTFKRDKVEQKISEKYEKVIYPSVYGSVYFSTYFPNDKRSVFKIEKMNF